MSQHGVAPQHMPRELFNSPYVFIRCDSHKPPLTPPYEGPYKSCNEEQSLFRLMLAAGKKLFLWIASSLLLSTQHFRSNRSSQETRKTTKIIILHLLVCFCVCVCFICRRHLSSSALFGGELCSNRFLPHC